jgi:hypothetical protein
MFWFLRTFADPDVFARVSSPALLTRALADGNADWVPVIREVFSDEPFDTRIVDATCLRRATYGELLYVEFRCAWLHEYAGGSVESRPFLWRDDQGRHEPHYSNTMEGPFHVNRRLVFPRAFLLATLRRVLDAAEAYFLQIGTVPGVRV